MKRLIIGISIIVIAAVLVLVGMRIYTKSFSPEAKAEVQSNGFEATVNYCRPYKKGREIFGTSLQSLVPYGQVWRTGANEATVIRFNKDIVFADKQELKAGKYSIFSIPSPNEWIIIFNKETGQWGTSYDETQNVLLVKAKVQEIDAFEEQFFIDFRTDDNSLSLLLHWDNTQAVLPFRVK